MNEILTLLLRPSQFFNKLHDAKIKSLIIFIIIFYSILFFITEYYLSISGGKFALFYVDIKIIAVAISFILDFAIIFALALTIFLMLKLFKIKVQLLSLILSVLSIKVISVIGVLIRVLSFYLYADTKYINIITWIQFGFEMGYLFIAIKTITQISNRKIIAIQALSIVFVSLIANNFLTDNNDVKKTYSIKTNDEVNLDANRIVNVESLITWVINNRKLYSMHTGDNEIAEDRIYNYFYGMMYETLVTKYTFNDIPKELDYSVIEEILDKSNKQLSKDNFGLRIIDIKMSVKKKT